MALTQISTAGVKDDAVTSGKIPANAVGSSELADNAVDTAAIADDAVTAAKIANGTITNAQITDSTVGTTQLANDAVTNAKIADGTIIEANLANLAVNTTKISDASITAAKIQDGNVTTAKLQNNAVTNGKMASDAVATGNIVDQAVTLAKLEHGTSSNDGKFLRANNGADPTFETVTGTTISGNANNRIITGSDTANTLNADADVTYDAATSDFSILGSKPGTSMDLIVQNNGGGNAAGARITITSGTASNTGPQFGMICGSDNWYLQTPKNVGALDFHKNGTRTFRLLGDGGVEISDGDLKIGTAGHGISFNPHGSSNVNLLDDYEEGDWTPAPENLTNTPTYYNLQGKYTKIGRLVTIWGFIQVGGTQPTFANNAQHLHIAGLPFANNATTGYVGGVGPTTFQSLNVFGSSYNDYGANGTLVCGVANSTRIRFTVNPNSNGGIRGTVRRVALEGGPILTWTMQYQTTA